MNTGRFAFLGVLGPGFGPVLRSQPGRVPQDLAEQLLRRADEDAAGAKGMLPIDEVADVLVCFHAQQAVEKALKAVLAARGVEFAHRHDLRVLIGQCENAGVRLPEELAEVDLLSPYAESSAEPQAIDGG
jgi:HEPN domain-containing protein